jgi:short-subunit dehydrogenase
MRPTFTETYNFRISIVEINEVKIVFITGVSSGIGRSAATAFLKKGDFVIGTVRDKNCIQDLTKEYPQNFIPYEIDLINLDQISEISNMLKQKNIQKIDLLINNAGIAIAGPFAYQNFQEIINMMQINVISLMRLTQVLIPLISKSEDGRIINISSVSGQNGTPFLAGYCAAKHAVEGFSESLRREMNLLNIKVILIGPGSVKTPIWDKGFQKVQRLYEHTPFQKSFQKFISFAMNEQKNALDPQVIVDDIFHASFSRYPKIRYAPVPNKILDLFLSIVPKRMNDFLNFKSLSLERHK